MSNKPRAEIRQVTPEWAMAILEKHSQSQVDGSFRQRNLNENTAKLYAADMKSGNWTLNGQGISFDDEENLLDGQHRLAAVVRAGITVPMLVMWDLPARVNNNLKTIDTFDIGKKRSIANQLRIEGVSYYAEIATASRLLVLMAGQRGVKIAVSPPQGIAVANLMMGHLQKLIEVIQKNGGTKNKIAGRLLAPMALLRTAEADTADLFAMEFAEMANLGKQSPVLHFQKFLDRPAMITKGMDYSWRCVLALSSALFNYSNDKRVDNIRGNQEHFEWLLKVSKNAVKKIREVAGVELTIEELKN